MRPYDLRICPENLARSTQTRSGNDHLRTQKGADPANYFLRNNSCAATRAVNARPKTPVNSVALDSG